jgi:hypothetical protein
MLSIPAHTQDRPHKVLVMIHDWMYTIDVYPSTNEQASVGETVHEDISRIEPLEPASIERQLREIVQHAQGRRERGEHNIPIGMLSGGDRDRWAKVSHRDL